MRVLHYKAYLKSTPATMLVLSGVNLVIFDKLTSNELVFEKLFFNEMTFNRKTFLIHNNQKGT